MTTLTPPSAEHIALMREFTRQFESGERDSGYWQWEAMENGAWVPKIGPSVPVPYEYLGDYIFNFETHDSAYSELFAKKALEVCAAISDRKTFEYIEEPNNRLWYLLMCNMPFFVDKIECGTSIRGSWWQHEDIEFSSCGLWDGARQMSYTMTFTSDQWREFISAMRAFAHV